MSNRRKASKKDLQDMIDRNAQRREANEALLPEPSPPQWSDPASNPLEDVHEWLIQTSRNVGKSFVMGTRPLLAVMDEMQEGLFVLPAVTRFADELALDPEKTLGADPDKWSLESLLTVVAKMTGSNEDETHELRVWRAGFHDGINRLKPAPLNHGFTRFYDRGYRIAKTLRDRLEVGAYAWEGG